MKKFEMPTLNSESAQSAVIRTPSLPVIICDDHIAIRTGLRLILEKEQVQVVGECGSVTELLNLLRLHPSAIVVTDLGVDDLPFPTLVTRLREQSSTCQIVVYSMREAAATISFCYEAGAIAFVPKSADPAEIVMAIHHASSGTRYFPATVASELAGLLLDRTSPKAILTEREFEIFMDYIREGTIEVLAGKLQVSDKTVQNLLSQIAKKLGTPRSTFENLARKHGLLDW